MIQRRDEFLAADLVLRKRETAVSPAVCRRVLATR